MAPITIMMAKKPQYSKSTVQLLEAIKEGTTRKRELKKLIERKDIDPFLKEGIEIYLLDLPYDEFKDIMTERIYRSRQRDEDNVNLFRRLSKYPPAFGLVGTVFGLVALMRSVGEGADASQIGLNMALALVATLYGLATANFLLAPIAEFFQNHADESKVFKELILEGLLMCYQDSQILTIQEMLNSYLDPRERVDVIGINRVGA